MKTLARIAKDCGARYGMPGAFLGMILLTSCAAAPFLAPVAIEFARNLVQTSLSNYGSKHRDNLSNLVNRLASPYTQNLPPVAAGGPGMPGQPGFPGQPGLPQQAYPGQQQIPGQQVYPGQQIYPGQAGVYDPNTPYGGVGQSYPGAAPYPGAATNPYGTAPGYPNQPGTNPYDPNNPYVSGMGGAYGQQANPYGTPSPYGQQNQYGSAGGTQNPYGTTSPYGQSTNPYGTTNPYGSSTPYGNTTQPAYGQPYGQTQPGYGQTYGQSGYGSASPYGSVPGQQPYGGPSYGSTGVYPRGLDAEPIAVDVAMIRQKQTAKGKEVVLMNDGEVLEDGGGNKEAGDRFKIVVRTNCDCYLYVVSIDGSGWAEPVFPTSGGKETNPVKKDQEYAFPDAGHWYTLDQIKGIETFYVVASANRRSDLEESMAQLAAEKRPDTKIVAKVEEPPIVPRGVGSVRSRGILKVQDDTSTTLQVTPLSYAASQAHQDVTVTRWFRHE